MANRAYERWLASLILCFSLVIMPGSHAQAHPHAYIDVEVTAVFDDSGRLTALEQRWLFDPAYTAFALFDLRDASALAIQQRLEEIMTQNLLELRAFDFFTEIKQADGLIQAGSPVDGQTRLVDQQIEMTFTLPVTGQTTDVKPVTYYVFDPTYYIQMRHSLTPNAIRVEHPSKACQYDLVEPTPTTEQILFAANLGVNVTAPPGLGRLFTETVTITCDTA